MRFAVHRPSQRRTSPHGVSRRDVECRVQVCVEHESAGLAPEHRLALAIVRRGVPAPAATLTRVRGRDLLHTAGRLVFKATDEHPPAGGENASVQPSFLPDVPTRLGARTARRAGHVLYSQILYPDKVKPASQARAGLLDPVLAPVSIAGPQARDHGGKLGSPRRAAPGTGQLPLQYTQPGPVWPGAVQQFPGRQRCRYSDTSVYADHLPRAGSRNRFRHYRESDVPAARRITGHPVGLRVTHGASASVSHPADLRDQCFGPPTVDDACSACLAADYLKAFVPSRPAPRRATVCASEEVPPGAISISQRLLLHGHRTSRKPANGSARLGQLAALLCVVRRTTSACPPVPAALFQSQIPYIASMRAVLDQHCLLRGRWIEPEPGHVETIAKVHSNNGHLEVVPRRHRAGACSRRRAGECQRRHRESRRFRPRWECGPC